MPPTIHCVRHGQGFHNLGAGNYALRDPGLTPLGEEQARNLQKLSFPDQSRISLVAASPLRRTLHTAFLTFEPALEPGGKRMQILGLPDAQETSDDQCDTGSDPSTLRDIVAENGWPVDLSLVQDGWNVKTLENQYSPHSDAIKARAQSARLLLRQKARELVESGDVDAQIVLVTHGGFLHYFTDDWEDADQLPGTGWCNGEMRSYVFEEDMIQGRDGDARLIETKQSRQSRGKDYPMLGREKQPVLFAIAMRRWEDQGLQRPDKLGTVGDVCAELLPDPFDHESCCSHGPSLAASDTEYVEDDQLEVAQHAVGAMTVANDSGGESRQNAIGEGDGSPKG